MKRVAQLPRSLPILAPELQFYDITSTYTSVPAGSSLALSGLSQGDGANNRDGVVIHPVSLELRLGMICGLSTDSIRVIISRHLTDLAPYNVTQILESVTAGIGFVSPYNMEYHGQSQADRRIEILYDTTINVGTDWHNRQTRSVSIPLNTAKHNLIRYLTGNGTNVPIMGGLMFQTFGNQAGVNAPIIVVYSRLHFLDA